MKHNENFAHEIFIPLKFFVYSTTEEEREREGGRKGGEGEREREEVTPKN